MNINDLINIPFYLDFADFEKRVIAVATRSTHKILIPKFIESKLDNIRFPLIHPEDSFPGLKFKKDIYFTQDQISQIFRDKKYSYIKELFVEFEYIKDQPSESDYEIIIFATIKKICQIIRCYVKKGEISFINNLIRNFTVNEWENDRHCPDIEEIFSFLEILENFVNSHHFSRFDTNSELSFKMINYIEELKKTRNLNNILNIFPIVEYFRGSMEYSDFRVIFLFDL